MKRLLLSLCMLGLFSSQPMRSADWDGCHSDLDDLKRKSDDAASKAEEVSDAETRLKSCKSDDEKRDCRSEADSYESAKDDLESALQDVAFKIKSVSHSCGIDLSRTPSLADANVKFCTSLNRHKSALPASYLLEQCKKAMSDEECRKCLGLK